MENGNLNYWILMLSGLTLIAIGGFMMLTSDGVLGYLIATLGGLCCGVGASQYEG